MLFIPEGRIISLVFSIAFSLLYWYSLKKAKIELPYVRRLLAMDAIDDALGRCAEMGKPAHYTCGNALIDTALAPMTIAGLNVLGYVSQKCAVLGVPLIVSIMEPKTIPMHEDIVRQGYVAEGKPELYNPDNIRFHSSEQSAFSSAVFGIFQKERPATNIVIGPHKGQIYSTLESSQRVGAITISGTARIQQIPVCVVMSDHSLIGDDIYAASAYVTKDPLRRGHLRGSDIIKLFAIVIVLIGSVASILGISTLVDLLGM